MCRNPALELEEVSLWFSGNLSLWSRRFPWGQRRSKVRKKPPVRPATSKCKWNSQEINCFKWTFWCHLVHHLEKEMATHAIQSSCLENPMDRGAWPAVVHGVTKSRTLLRDCATMTASRSAASYPSKKSPMSTEGVPPPPFLQPPYSLSVSF